MGLAVSDPTATIATPLPTLRRRAGKRPPLRAIEEVVREHEVVEIVLGLPLTLDGTDSDWTREVRNVGQALADRLELPVHFIDERMTSIMAERAVRSLGLPKNERERKERVDAAAAMIILQRWLDRPEVQP